MASSAVPIRERRKEFRGRYLEEQAERLATLKAQWRANPSDKDDYFKIKDVIFQAPSIDMKTFTGTEEELEVSMERLYANDGR
jgi:hypothetical protein